MPNIKSAKKRVLLTKKRTLRNKSLNSALRTSIKKANLAVEEGSTSKQEAVKVAVRKIDMSVSKGLLHKNTAARKKSSLMRKLNETV